MLTSRRSTSFRVWPLSFALSLGLSFGCGGTCPSGTTQKGDLCVRNNAEGQPEGSIESPQEDADGTAKSKSEGGMGAGESSNRRSAVAGSQSGGRSGTAAGSDTTPEGGSTANGAGNGGASAVGGTTSATNIPMSAMTGQGGMACGDGKIEPPEVCDPMSPALPCPTSCDDGVACTMDVMMGKPASCDARCEHTPITSAASGDGCCPPGATPQSDADCAAVCPKNACGGCTTLTVQLNAPCSAGIGECKVEGSYQCQGTDKLECSAQARPAATEVCDGKDNDCDGIVDNNVKNACGGCAKLSHDPGDACSDGSGGCKTDGTYRCDGTDRVSCSAVARASSPEKCDGVDNDCNGMIDDGVGTFWFPDCDGDGYAPQGVGTKACSKPQAMGGCGWTQRDPTGVAAADCDDRNVSRHPGTDFGLPITQQGAGLPPARDWAYDLNCDGKQEPTGATMSTGMFKGGSLETVEVCQTATCTNETCISSISVLGEIVCGQPYTYDTNCSTKVTVYFYCR